MPQTRYECPFPGCAHSVSRQADLGRHMETHDESTKSRNRCPFPDCEYHTRQKANVRQHLEACHGIVMPLSRKPPRKTGGRGGRHGMLKNVARLVESDYGVTDRMYSVNQQFTTFQVDPLSSAPIQKPLPQEERILSPIPVSNDVAPAAVHAKDMPFISPSESEYAGHHSNTKNTKSQHITAVHCEEDAAMPTMAPMVTEVPRQLVASRQIIEHSLHRPLRYTVTQYEVYPYADHMNVQQYGPGYFRPYHRVHQQTHPMPVVHAPHVPQCPIVVTRRHPSMNPILAHYKRPEPTATVRLAHGSLPTFPEIDYTCFAEAGKHTEPA